MIFLDTGFLFALFVEGDDHHDRVLEVFRGRRLQDLLITTNHVIAETVALLRKKGHPDRRARHGLAVNVGEQLLAGTLGQAIGPARKKNGPPLTTWPSTRTRTTAPWAV